MLFYNHRIVVPKVLWNDMLQVLYRSHQGVSSCMKRARHSMFWPGLYKHIEEYVVSCVGCQKYSNPRQPMSPHLIPDYPFQKEHVLSPSELLMGRIIRNMLPIAKKNFGT